MKSVSEMTDEELLEHLRRIRSSRVTQKKSTTAYRARKAKAKAKADKENSPPSLKGLGKNELQSLLATLEEEFGSDET